MKYPFLIFFLLITSLSSFQKIYSKSSLINFSGDSLIVKDSTHVTSYNNSSKSDSSELIIRKLTIYSGKRPSTEEKENAKEKYWLIRIHFNRGISASRVIDLERDGKKLYLEYDPIMSFETSVEAIEYAKKNGIVDILIE